MHLPFFAKQKGTTPERVMPFSIQLSGKSFLAVNTSQQVTHR
jgi:hypothetical protein